MVGVVYQVVEALESHMAVLRGTLKRKKSMLRNESAASMKPRAASMTVDVS